MSASSRKLSRAQSTGAATLNAGQAIGPRLSAQDVIPPLPAVSEIDDQFEKLLVRRCGIFLSFVALLTVCRRMLVRHGLKHKRKR